MPGLYRVECIAVKTLEGHLKAKVQLCYTQENVPRSTMLHYNPFENIHEITDYCLPPIICFWKISAVFSLSYVSWKSLLEEEGGHFKDQTKQC